MNEPYPLDKTSDMPDQLRGSSPPANGSVSKAQRLWDALKCIASYDSPERVRRDAEPMGLDENEAVEMAYENVIAEAKAAVRQMRRPK